MNIMINKKDEIVNHSNEKKSKSKLIEFFIRKFNSGFKLLGPFFAFFLIVLILFVLRAYIRFILPFYSMKLGIIFGILLSIYIVFSFFNLLCNFFLASAVKPGCIEDIRNSYHYLKVSPMLIPENTIDLFKLFKKKCNTDPNKQTAIDLKKDFNEADNSILEISNQNKSQESFNLNICHTCNEIRPLRSHHCFICGVCVFKMDHHCPWINNCVGHYNHKYFLLFLTWLLILSLSILLLCVPIILCTNLIKNDQFSFIFTLSCCTTAMMTLFNIWNWFLVINGNTSIEFWSKLNNIKNKNSYIKDFSLSSWEDNFFVVFGSRSVIRSIFCLSIKRNPLSGLEWSKFSKPEYLYKNHEEMRKQIEIIN